MKSLGVTAIWTTPVYDNNDRPDTKEVYPGVPETTGYHGYGAVDMYAVDEHLGDMAKLREFVIRRIARLESHSGSGGQSHRTVSRLGERPADADLVERDGARIIRITTGRNGRDESARDVSNAGAQHRRLVYRHSAGL
jgi:hypothetical protein